MDINITNKNGIILNTRNKVCEDDININIDNSQEILPENIAKGVTILGVTGTLEPSNIDQLISGEITTLNIPNKTTKIRDWAFYKCPNLSNITIPNSVTSIGESAFSNCGLTSITIPNSVTNIGSDIFEKCSNLVSLTIPFYKPSIFGTSSYANSTNCNGYYIPNSLESITLTNSKTIENELFKSYTMLKNVTLNDGVTSIGDGVFNGCSNLVSLTIPFYKPSIFGTSSYTDSTNCNGYYIPYSLHSITLTNSKTIENELFRGYQMLKNITLNDGVTSIGNYAFSGCSSLTSITIPNSVTSIGNYVFYNCTGLTSIVISNGVTSIGQGSFDSCSSLTSITIPNSVTSIGNYVFDSCTNLTSINIPDSVISIGEGAFHRCRGLSSIDIPNSVTNIGNYAFGGCYSLTSINISDNVTSIGDGVFDNCYTLTSITIPDSVTSIGVSAFISCRSLTSITIPNSVTRIGNWAFSDCSKLTSITIPNSVTSIGTDIFGYCSKLTDVTIENGFNANNLNLSASTNYTHDTILSWLNALYDRTGLDTYKFIIGTTNLNKLTDEEKAIATNKNWTLA